LFSLFSVLSNEKLLPIRWNLLAGGKGSGQMLLGTTSPTLKNMPVPPHDLSSPTFFPSLVPLISALVPTPLQGSGSSSSSLYLPGFTPVLRPFGDSVEYMDYIHKEFTFYSPASAVPPHNVYSSLPCFKTLSTSFQTPFARHTSEFQKAPNKKIRNANLSLTRSGPVVYSQQKKGETWPSHELFYSFLKLPSLQQYLYSDTDEDNKRPTFGLNLPRSLLYVALVLETRRSKLICDYYDKTVDKRTGRGETLKQQSQRGIGIRGGPENNGPPAPRQQPQKGNVVRGGGGGAENDGLATPPDRKANSLDTEFPTVSFTTPLPGAVLEREWERYVVSIGIPKKNNKPESGLRGVQWKYQITFVFVILCIVFN
jgi:hypothetical protein